MKRNLSDMTVVITGASAGIGEQLARDLHARGARLMLAARRTDRLEALNAELGGSHKIVTADVAQQADCQRLIDTAFAEFGRIDTLVLNAGYGIYPLVHETTPEATRAIFATNVFGTTDCIHAAVGRMLEQPVRDGWRGQVVIVSSAAARRAVPYLGIYSATKAAQLSVAEAMRVELRPCGLAVTSIHPGMTRTEFGKVAEQGSGVKLPDTDRGNWTQSVNQVTARIVKAIERPRPEVWPMRPIRWALSLMTCMPGVADRGMASYRDRVKKHNSLK